MVGAAGDGDFGVSLGCKCKAVALGGVWRVFSLAHSSSAMVMRLPASMLFRASATRFRVFSVGGIV